jgi:DNA topoisomerase-1
VARFTEASLIKDLEARGIGRPSTYATIMDTIVRREYVFKQGTALVPTFIAFAVVALMEKHFSHLVDYTFTAEMEQDLDKIAEGEKKSVPYLNDFYFGSKGHAGLSKLISQDIDAKEVCTIEVEPGGKKVDYQVRIGRFGPYIEKGDKKAPLPDDTVPAELTPEKAEEILANSAPEADAIGQDKASGLPIVKKVGRFGPYLQMGEKGDKGFKMKSIPKFLNPDAVTMEQCEEILSWPKSLGKLKTGEEVMFDVGPYGPYLKVNGVNKAIPEGVNVMELTIDDAQKILSAAPAAKGKHGGPGNGNNAVRDFGNGIVAKIGRYGAYVTDGKINAAIPRGQRPESLTPEAAKELIDKKKI